MTLRDALLKTPSFTFERNIFFQKEMERSDEFEKTYSDLREKENRIYPDEIIQKLPSLPEALPQEHEWVVRGITMRNLIKYLSRKNHNGPILELGCGNGWLAHQLAISLHREICAIDINKSELLQGARLFKTSGNLIFVCGNIFRVDFKKRTFDTILLPSSVQYFPNLKQLINRLFEILKPSGEIHIVDSPFYRSATESKDAKKRSYNYFDSRGLREMTNHYFHHTLLDLKEFNPTVLFNPNSLIPLIKRKILKIPQAVFPWVLIKSNEVL